MLRINVGDTIETYFDEKVKVIDIVYDKTCYEEKAYVLDENIKIRNSKEPYNNPNREQYVDRNHCIMFTSDIKTTVKNVLKEDLDNKQESKVERVD